MATVPDYEFATTVQVASFHEAELSTLRSVLYEHRDEFAHTGYRVIKGPELRKLKGLSEDRTALGKSNQIGIWDRKAVLLLGMLLRDSEVAKTVRAYLLAAEERAHGLIAAWMAVVQLSPLAGLSL
ncbi:MAG: hypothetical protein ACRC20_10175 [Segniliparus sp.]|uniref:hypothetical protein n=1 Tax=Segniliparus sp. TaxID=2804064 RepID=UPI003F3C0069